MKMLKSYLTCESGTTALEYALIAALVSIAGLKSLHCVTTYLLLPTFATAEDTLNEANKDLAQ